MFVRNVSTDIDRIANEFLIVHFSAKIVFAAVFLPAARGELEIDSVRTRFLDFESGGLFGLLLFCGGNLGGVWREFALRGTRSIEDHDTFHDEFGDFKILLKKRGGNTEKIADVVESKSGVVRWEAIAQLKRGGGVIAAVILVRAKVCAEQILHRIIIFHAVQAPERYSAGVRLRKIDTQFFSGDPVRQSFPFRRVRLLLTRGRHE